MWFKAILYIYIATNRSSFGTFTNFCLANLNFLYIKKKSLNKTNKKTPINQKQLDRFVLVLLSFWLLKHLVWTKVVFLDWRKTGWCSAQNWTDFSFIPNPCFVLNTMILCMNLSHYPIKCNICVSWLVLYSLVFFLSVEIPVMVSPNNCSVFKYSLLPVFEVVELCGESFLFLRSRILRKLIFVLRVTLFCCVLNL